jgi:predicted transposase YdaD
MGDWDKSLKTLVAGCPQAFAELILRQSDIKVADMLPTDLKGYDLEADSLLTVELREGEEIILLVEFQSVNDKEMGDRLLDYSARIKKKYARPVLACVIFLRKDGIVPEPPLIWELFDGKNILTFNYVCIKLWELNPEVLLAFNQPSLLPLTLLTKGGAHRTMVERVFEGLLEHGLKDLLPASNLLAGLVLDKNDLEWLQRRFQQMNDILKQSPAYRWMTDDAREEGLKEGLEQGREQASEQFRAAIIEIVAGRFPHILSLAQQAVRHVTSVERLQHTVVKLSLAHDEDNVEQYLLALEDKQGESAEK